MVVLHCPFSWGLSPSSQRTGLLLLHGAVCGALDVNDLGFWMLSLGAEGRGLVPGSVLSCGTHRNQISGSFSHVTVE